MDNVDYTLDELRISLAPSIAEGAVFDGWGDQALEDAARANGVDPAVARLAYPRGAIDMIDAWIVSIDEAMAQALPQSVLAAMPIRERIRALVQFRLDAVLGEEEAVRRALAILAMPKHIRRSLRTGWHSADVMWRLAGDTATDYNHYTKRTLLAGIYSATLGVFIDDESEGKAETRDFLARRIEGVMRFEKAKAKWLGSSGEHFSMVRFLGRLRYPAR
ncbi:MAG: COQ9 family protein [Sphingomonadaceae bacterium]